MRPMRWACDDVVTTRGAAARSTSGSTSPVEREVPEVVRAELHLEPVGRAPQRDRHHAGVVHQHVEPRRATPPTVVGRGRDRTEVGEVEPHHLGLGARRRRLDLVEGGRRLGLVAARHQHPAPAPGERFGAAQPEPAVGARDEHGAPGLVGDVALVPPRHEVDPFTKPRPVTSGRSRAVSRPGGASHDGGDGVDQAHRRGLEAGGVVVAVAAEQLQVERVVRLAGDHDAVAALAGRLRPVRARGRRAAG